MLDKITEKTLKILNNSIEYAEKNNIPFVNWLMFVRELLMLDDDYVKKIFSEIKLDRKKIIDIIDDYLK